MQVAVLVPRSRFWYFVPNAGTDWRWRGILMENA